MLTFMRNPFFAYKKSVPHVRMIGKVLSLINSKNIVAY